MFFESALSGKNQWWRYLVMFLVAFLASNLIGSIPLIIAIVVSTAKDPSIMDNPPENLMDFSVYGIDSNLGLIYIVIPFIVGLVAFALLMKPLNDRPFRSVINGGSKIRWGRILFSFSLWASLFAIYLIVSLKLDPENFTLNNQSSSLITLAIVALLFAPSKIPSTGSFSRF